MIMGRKTFQSLGRVLPGRKHIILTNNKDFHVEDENVEVFHDIESLKPYIDSEEEYFVIGGGQIYKLLHPILLKCISLEFMVTFKVIPTFHSGMRVNGIQLMKQ